MFETKNEYELGLVQDVVGDLHKLRVGFAMLTEGAIDEYPDEYDELLDYCRDAFDRGPLVKMLSSAHNFRVLKISAPSCAPSRATISFAGSVGKRTSPHLREFGVSNMRCAEDELVDFLLRHREKLRRLSMSYIELTEGTWASVFERIAGQFPKLRKLKLSGDLASEDDIRIIGHPIEPELKFDVPGLIPGHFNPIADAVANFVKYGGDYQRYLTAAKRRVVEEEFPEVCVPHPDFEFDSDGSYVSYGSDELDMIIWW